MHTDRTHRSIWVLVIGLVIIGLVSEVVTTIGIYRASKIMRRTEQEFRDSERLRSYSASGKPTMLLYGNSLLLEGIDYPEFRDALSKEYDVHRLVFEQTQYLDQYYLLRSLLRHGCRPHDLVLVTSVDHFIGNGTRGDFMARFMDAVDVTSLGRRQHVDATTLSSSLFAHWSAWFAFRAETRKVLLGKIMPDARDMATVLAWRKAEIVGPDVVRAKAAPRLKELKELCDQYGIRLTIVVPPVILTKAVWETKDNPAALASAGAEVGVPVLVPEQPGDMAADLFRDGYHLTPDGARIFTAKLQSEIVTPEP